MKVIRFRTTFSYLKNCANKARNWLALTARRFPCFRQTPDPSLSNPASVSSSDASLSPPNSPMIIAPQFSETAQYPIAPIAIPSRSSLMSISGSSLVTPDFSSHYAIPSFSPTFTPLTPLMFSAPTSTTTSIRSIESSRVSTGSTPPAHSGGHSTIQEILEIHRLSPTPSFFRNPPPPLDNDASPPDSVTLLPTRTSRPYAYCSADNSVVPTSPPTYSRPAKRSFSLSIVDESNTQPYKRNKRIQSESSLLGQSNTPTYLRNKRNQSESLFKKRRFSVLKENDQQLQPYKRYKTGSRVRLYRADIFPGPSASRYHHGWFLDEDKFPVFWASLRPTTDSSRVLNDLHEE